MVWTLELQPVDDNHSGPLLHITLRQVFPKASFFWDVSVMLVDLWVQQKKLRNKKEQEKLQILRES